GPLGEALASSDVVVDVVQAVGAAEVGIGAVARPTGEVPALVLRVPPTGELQLVGLDHGQLGGVSVGGDGADAHRPERAPDPHLARAARGVEVDGRWRGKTRGRGDEEGEAEKSMHAWAGRRWILPAPGQRVTQATKQTRATAPSSRWSSD